MRPVSQDHTAACSASLSVSAPSVLQDLAAGGFSKASCFCSCFESSSSESRRRLASRAAYAWIKSFIHGRVSELLLMSMRSEPPRRFQQFPRQMRYDPFLSHWDRDQENWAFADCERSKQARSMNPVLNST
jgi:hypothetical protein